MTTNPPPSENQIGGVPTAEGQAGVVPPQAPSSDWSAAIEESAEIPEGVPAQESPTEETVAEEEEEEEKA